MSTVQTADDADRMFTEYSTKIARVLHDAGWRPDPVQDGAIIRRMIAGATVALMTDEQLVAIARHLPSSFIHRRAQQAFNAVFYTDEQ